MLGQRGEDDSSYICSPREPQHQETISHVLTTTYSLLVHGLIFEFLNYTHGSMDLQLNPCF